MADDLFALADLLKINDISLADNEVNDLLNDAPFMSRLLYVTATHGTIHKYTKESGAPVVGFRAANAGRDLDSSVDTEVSETLQIIDFTSEIDQAIANAYVKGGKDAKVARESFRHLKAAMFAYEKQLFSGTIHGDAAGFDGMADVLPDTDTTDMVINAGGTGAGTGSSAWLIRVGEDDVVGVLGNDGVFDLGETVSQKRVVNPGTDNKSFPTYYTPGTGYTGMQVGSIYSFGRICNLTESAGGGLTDDLVAQALSEFPSARQPTVMCINRRSLRQLQQSRTATNPTGAPAPMPEESMGVPILLTDAIINTETLITAA